MFPTRIFFVTILTSITISSSQRLKYTCTFLDARRNEEKTIFVLLCNTMGYVFTWSSPKVNLPERIHFDDERMLCLLKMRCLFAFWLQCNAKAIFYSLALHSITFKSRSGFPLNFSFQLVFPERLGFL